MKLSFKFFNRKRFVPQFPLVFIPIVILLLPLLLNLNYSHKVPPRKCEVNIAIILCSEQNNLNSTLVKNKPLKATDFSRQIKQALVMLKSLVLQEFFSKSKGDNCLNVIVIADDFSIYSKLKSLIYEEEKWGEDFTRFLHFTFVPVHYPPGSEWMRKLFRPCATLRLFLPEVLPAWDSVIYLDTDFLFLRNIRDLWVDFRVHLKDAKSQALAGMAPCLFHYGTKNNRVPFFGSSGLNAGLMLMDLKKMRESRWTQKIRAVTAMYKSRIKLADQDILNIYFHFYPEELRLVSCDWNFRAFNCREGSFCHDRQLIGGISSLHGNALSFSHEGSEPLFRSVFSTFSSLPMNQTHKIKSIKDLIDLIEIDLHRTEQKTHSECEKYGGFDVLLLNRLYSLIEEF